MGECVVVKTTFPGDTKTPPPEHTKTYPSEGYEDTLLGNMKTIVARLIQRDLQPSILYSAELSSCGFEVITILIEGHPES